MQSKRAFIVRAAVITAAALLALFAFAACGGDDNNDNNGGGGGSPTATAPAGGGAPTEMSPTEMPDQTSGGEVTSCDLVTKDEAAAVLGEPVSDADTSTGACVYAAEATDSFASVSVSLSQDMGDAETAQQVFDGGHDVSVAEDLSGLGDQAYWDPAGTVGVRKGSYILIVNVALADGSFSTDEAKQAAIDVAGTAVGRMP